MNELISITDQTIGDELTQTVNARELHEFLESKQDFSNWIRGRIKQYGLIEGADFTLNKIIERRATRIDYYLTVDAAKELAMIERNDKGRQARQYFIECEKRLNQAPALPDDLSRMDILKLAMKSEEERLKLEKRIEQDAPRVAFAKQVEIAPDAISVSKAAKIIGTGQRRLFTFLRQAGWITRRNEPYQSKIESGYLDVKLGSWEHPDHGLQKSVTTLITGKGLRKLQQLWDDHHEPATSEDDEPNWYD